MGFGNPYGDPWNVETVQKWVDVLADIEVKIMALSDTIGVSTPDSIRYLFSNLIPPYPDVEFGAHLHTTPSTWIEKIEAAYDSGCLRFDGALKGFGGCPMAKDELTGNMPTENLIRYFEEKTPKLGISSIELRNSLELAQVVFAGQTT
jgi:hydroxymethylglutaryl-CoA lyase